MGLDFVWNCIKEVHGLVLVQKAKIKTSIMYLCKFHTNSHDVLDKSGYCREEEHFEKHFKEGGILLYQINGMFKCSVGS